MNWKAASDYLNAQSKFCHQRFADSQGTESNFAMLGDIYAVMSQAILVGLCPSIHDFPPHASD